jgi:prepilin-type N-terminal cleavage/methylation domain-containing protein
VAYFNNSFGEIKMRRIQRQKGFTLVELAIVIVIIGLLIGGILKGQELMKNARVTATINQVSAIEAATNTFYDSRGYYPGDADGTSQIPGCGAGCVPDSTKVKNGTIGPAAWNFTSYTTIAAGSEEQETALFWFYLAATNLLSGLDGTAPTNTLVFGKSAPAAKIGNGGFTVGNSNGVQAGPRNPTAGAITITGTVLALTVSPVGGLTGIDAPGTPGSMPMTPAMAAQMDRKRDDGKPSGGSMQAWGATGCTVGAFAAASTYNEGNTGKDCGEIIGITQ